MKHRPIPLEFTEQTLRRFWKKVDKGPHPKGCWLWIAGGNNNGYGQVSIGRQMFLSHRLSYVLAHHEDPGELFVCHQCDNPRCVNPEHFFLGTRKQNNDDKVQKGRGVNPVLYGEYAPSHKLTRAKVIEIRRRYAEGGVSQAYLARINGVSVTQVCNIVNDQQWRFASDLSDFDNALSIMDDDETDEYYNEGTG